MKVPPFNPTPEMLIAGRRQCAADMTGPHMGPDIGKIWAAMYAAAPAHPEALETGKVASLLVDIADEETIGASALAEKVNDTASLVHMLGFPELAAAIRDLHEERREARQS